MELCQAGPYLAPHPETLREAVQEGLQVEERSVLCTGQLPSRYSTQEYHVHYTVHRSPRATLTD
jgi:hypothetical protein